ncbi:DUF2812 domain-containing protein [Jeotgalibacillus terrae]|uniref:DUF2812 domain-containing protein n=1 Tax=Jeotgalibacillus terrae TaxID=587735 RepID=A0ABW5ZM81_9BACL|nr:DUF2812 domain-containing protein [Jeotgalibacillus terrae]MBM7578169.1 hypothetical protein [Jeotgalibacillus terrae]
MEKKVTRIFWAWQDAEEEIWLRKMSNEGWKLKSYKSLRYTFEQITPEDAIYRLDYKTTTNEDLDEYIAIYEDAGWEHVAQFSGWHYFRSAENNSAAPDIYSDQASKIQKYSGLLTTLYISLLALLLLSISVFLNDSESVFFTALKWMYVIVIAIMVIAVVKVLIKIRRLKDQTL